MWTRYPGFPGPRCPLNICSCNNVYVATGACISRGDAYRKSARTQLSCLFNSSVNLLCTRQKMKGVLSGGEVFYIGHEVLGIWSFIIGDYTAHAQEVCAHM